MRIPASIAGFGVLLLTSLPVWPQQGGAAPPAPAASAPVLGIPSSRNSSGPVDTAPPETGLEDRMLTPPPVSGQVYPLAVGSERRSNYLRGGVAFNTAYSDNVLGGSSAQPVSDVSYSVWPTLALDQTTPRLHWTASYAPGFTFYRRTSSRNESDQYLSIDLQYRLSPHATLSLRDGLQKSSSVFNQPGQGLAGAVSGTDLAANLSIVAPLADRLSNSGNAGITDQFSAHDLIGAGGTFSNLHYPNPSQVPGLFDSATRAGSGFYSHRWSAQHYLGATYQYQELLSYPPQTTNRTATNAVLFFYSYYPSPAFSLSFYGGPQYYNEGRQYLNAAQPAAAGAKAWTPAAGASLNWQAQHTAAALSFAHSISGGGGLAGAVTLDSGNAFVRQQLTPRFSASLAAGYANNGVISLASLGGHTLSGSASMQYQVGANVNLQAGYTRLHQTYNVFSANPDTNREWVSIAWQFLRPIGQ